MNYVACERVRACCCDLKWTIILVGTTQSAMGRIVELLVFRCTRRRPVIADSIHLVDTTVVVLV